MSRLPQVLQFEPAVSQLPLRLRPVLRAAAAGSTADIKTLLRLTETVAKDQVGLFLPAFYSNLHPRLIPTAEQVDNNSGDLPIEHVFYSLRYLAHRRYDLPPNARVAIWNRVRVWVEFFYTYWAYVPRLSSYPDFSLCVAILTVVVRLHKLDGQIAKEMHQIPSLCVLMARGWKLLIPEPAREISDDAMDGLGSVSLFLGNQCHSAHRRRPRGTTYLEDFAQGAGGTLAHLASLVITHLNHYVTRQSHAAVELLMVFGVISLVQDNSDNGLFQDALLSQGCIITFLRITDIFSATRTVGLGGDRVLLPAMRLSVWHYMHKQLAEPRAYRHVGEAIRGGIFRTLIASASAGHSTDEDPSLRKIIRWLEIFSVYYSILSCMEPALEEVKQLQGTPAFTKSKLFSRWTDFWDFVQRRITIMKHYESEDYVSFKACGTLQCGNIHRKRDLMCCSSCKQQYYCSQRCQSVDWNDGHREACARTTSLNQIDPEDVSARNRSFLRALIDYDYNENQANILQWELDFMTEHPGELPCLIFNYTHSTEPWMFRFVGGNTLLERWPHEVSRAARSGGRIQLHMALVPAAAVEDRLRLFPMQSSSGALSNGLKRLKRQVDEGEGGSAPLHEQIEARISALTALRVVHVH
ncbi:hypothetical protein DFH06DRAFT_1462574 [Mycena polygramma]|nr:hypothetical protein DFH06DRAFT_1462574 [Mycena polygramma]